MDNTILSIFFLGFISFFVLVNPLGIIPIYLGITSDFDEYKSKKFLKRSLLLSFIVLVMFSLIGQLILSSFNISVNSFKIVAAIIFFLIGMDLLYTNLNSLELTINEKTNLIDGIPITPMTIPFVCGPGAIINSIVLMEETKNSFERFSLIFSLIIVISITYLVLSNAYKIHKRIGYIGNSILMRFIGLIVLVISIEFFIKGYEPMVKNFYS